MGVFIHLGNIGQFSIGFPNSSSIPNLTMDMLEHGSISEGIIDLYVYATQSSEGVYWNSLGFSPGDTILYNWQ